MMVRMRPDVETVLAGALTIGTVCRRGSVGDGED